MKTHYKLRMILFTSMLGHQSDEGVFKNPEAHPEVIGDARKKVDEVVDSFPDQNALAVLNQHLEANNDDATALTLNIGMLDGKLGVSEMFVMQGITTEMRNTTNQLLEKLIPAQ